MRRMLVISLLFLTQTYAVHVAFDNTLTPDPLLTVTPFGPNAVEPISGLVVDLLGDQIQIDPGPNNWRNGVQATTSIYNIGDEFQGVLRLYLYSVSGGVLGSLIGTFDSAALAIPQSGMSGMLVTWDLGGILLQTDMVWLVGVQADNSPMGNVPLLSLENYISPQAVGSTSDAFHWWQLNTQSTVMVSSGFNNDSFYFHLTTVPEPATWFLLTSALAAAALTRRRARRSQLKN